MHTIDTNTPRPGSVTVILLSSTLNIQLANSFNYWCQEAYGPPAAHIFQIV